MKKMISVIIVLSLLLCMCVAFSENEIQENEIQYETLSKGDKGECVRQLQIALIAQGYLAGSADGDFGKMTEAAVSKFQSDHGIEANGIADEKTLELIYKLESERIEKAEADGLETPDPSATEEPTVHKKNREHKRRIAPKKPIIYLYPEIETELNVTLGKPEHITVSYPAYGDGWHVFAKPDGTLTDLETGRCLYALYWEGESETASPMDEGFVVAGADTAIFLEEKLALLGLSEREAEEFIVYWLPTLQENAYNLIRFETMEEIEDCMPLKISVEPDTLIRVLMAYKPLEEAVEVPEQVLPPMPERTGFTVVEWGGTRVD